MWNKIPPYRRCISPYDRLTTEIKSLAACVKSYVSGQINSNVHGMIIRPLLEKHANGVRL